MVRMLSRICFSQEDKTALVKDVEGSFDCSMSKVI